jgi:hypothetical protein
MQCCGHSKQKIFVGLVNFKNKIKTNRKGKEREEIWKSGRVK